MNEKRNPTFNPTLFLASYRMKAFACLSMLLLGFPSLQTLAEETPDSLFHFSFDGHVADNLGKSVLESQYRFSCKQPIVEAASPEFEGNTLLVRKERKESYIIRTPSLNFDSFTVVSRFKPLQANIGEFNIATGGYWLRWFTVFRNSSGNLCVAFNNERVKHEIPVKIKSDKWHTIVCRVDLKNKIVRTWVNQKDHQFTLPENFVLTPLEPKWKKKKYDVQEKHFSFDNRGNGRSCQAYIDEFCVFNGLVSPKVAVSCTQLGRIVSLINGNKFPFVQKRSDSTIEETQRKIFENLKGAGLPPTEKAFTEFLEEFASKKELDERTENLIGRLGARKFTSRSSATYQLRLVGLPALSQLKQVMETQVDPEVLFRASLLVKEMTVSDFESLSNIEFLRDSQIRAKEKAKDDTTSTSNLVPYLFASLAESENDFVRLRICEALLASGDSENDTLIQRSLNDPDKWVRLGAAMLLSRIASQATLTQKLQPLLADKEELVRLVATQALTIPNSLQNFRESKDWKMRYIANNLAYQIKLGENETSR